MRWEVGRRYCLPASGHRHRCFAMCCGRMMVRVRGCNPLGVVEGGECLDVNLYGKGVVGSHH